MFLLVMDCNAVNPFCDIVCKNYQKNCIILYFVVCLAIFGICMPGKKQIEKASYIGNTIQTREASLVENEDYIKVKHTIQDTTEISTYITNVALSKTGMVAILLWNQEVYVFSSKGDFLYAYELWDHGGQGYWKLFFDREDNLYVVRHFASKKMGNAILVFDGNSGVTYEHSVLLPEIYPQIESKFDDGIYLAYYKDGLFLFDEVSPYSVAIKCRARNEIISILNFRVAYDRYKSRMEKSNLIAHIYGIALLLIIAWAARKMKLPLRGILVSVCHKTAGEYDKKSK